MDRYQYLLVMAACVVVTLPLEFVFRARVYRRPRRVLRAVLPAVAVYLVWDLVAIARGHWTFDARWVTGWRLTGDITVEEVASFVVSRFCALLNLEASRLTMDPDERRVGEGRCRKGRLRGCP